MSEEKELLRFLKFSLLDYEELDTGVLEYIDDEKKKVLNYINKLQKENRKLKELEEADTIMLNDNLQEIEQLKHENEHLKEQLLISNSLDNMYNLYISKDKIREKIEELENIEQEEIDYSRIKFATIVLEELLEEE